MLSAISLVVWFFPRSESFHYEYEVGKPWRYGLLTAPYDFAIFRSDSAVARMEDSVVHQVVPRYLIEERTAEIVIRQARTSSTRLSTHASHHLKDCIETMYDHGVMLGEEKERLAQWGASRVILSNNESSWSVRLADLLTEKDVYESLMNDTLYGSTYAKIGLQRYIKSNLQNDTTAMRIEYARRRQQISATSGVVLAETRIIDQGEIVTPHTRDILESYRKEQQVRRQLSGSDTWFFVGRFLLVSLLLCGIYIFLAIYRPWIFVNQTEVFVAIGSVAVMTILTSLAERLAVGAVYIVPIGIVTIVLCTFHGSRTAFFCHVIMASLCALAAPSHFEYFFIQCIVGIVQVFTLRDGMQDRSQLMRLALYSLAGYVGVYFLYLLATEGSVNSMSWPMIVMMMFGSVLLLLSYLVIYAMENIFGFMSGVTLVELCNMGRGLLLRLSEEAPGTFQHSIQVANLAANAAREIGANISLVRTGALYHDIGKLWNPQMYTENQQGPSPHASMTVEESVANIKRHVTEGVMIARKTKLPNEIIDFIKTHHGCSMVKFFFIKWCNEHPDQQPDASLFAYEGPDPTTREQCILMMADCIEAASRSLKEYTHEAIRGLVEARVSDIVSSGRFNEAKISLQEIQRCKDAFVSSLESIHHDRIAYPQLKK